MHKPRSRDLRSCALARLDAGDPVGEVARLFDVHRTTLLRWRHRRAAGEVAPRPRPGRAPKIGPGGHSRLVAQVTAAPDATLREHCAAWQVVTGVPVSEASMGRALRKVHWTLKQRA
jgi:transposase